MNNKKNRDWFTLIEMVIVIVIMTLMLGLSMNFGAKRIAELKYQTSKEQFVNDINNLYSESLTSNYYNQKRYALLDISLASWSKIRDYTYVDSDGQIVFSGAGQIDKMFLSNIFINKNQSQNQNGTINIKPYTLWCKISFTENEKTATWSVLEFWLTSDDTQKTYCFEIKSNNCKLIEKVCK